MPLYIRCRLDTQCLGDLPPTRMWCHSRFPHIQQKSRVTLWYKAWKGSRCPPRMHHRVRSMNCSLASMCTLLNMQSVFFESTCHIHHIHHIHHIIPVFNACCTPCMQGWARAGWKFLTCIKCYLTVLATAYN